MTSNTPSNARKTAGWAARKARGAAAALAAALAAAATLSARAADPAAGAPPAAPTPVAAPATIPGAPPAIVPPGAPTTLPPGAPAAAAPSTQPAAPSGEAVVSIDNLGLQDKIHVLVGRGVVLKTDSRVREVSISQPDVATLYVKDPNTILLSSKKAGTTQLVVWDEQGRTRVINIAIDVDLVALTEQIHKTFPGSAIDVSEANGTILLRGRVANLQVAEQVTELVGAYGKVLNFLELAGGQQVILQVRFAEVSRDASAQLGFNAFSSDGRFQAGYVKGPGGSPIGGVASGAAGTTINPAVSIFGGGRVGQSALEGFVQAMRSNNLLRVLAEPNLTAISGQEASFLAGGEFPIPVPQAGGGGGTAITIDYKQFGVRLNFLPVVLGDGRIRLKVSPEVSDLDFTGSVSFNGFQIPSLTKRTVTTTIELNEGQTFSIAGLLNNRVTAANDAVPLLGDIPVLGTLFRSVRYERKETELVILVTPRLVEGMNPDQVPELPGEHWVFPTENDMFFSQYLGGPAPDAAAPTTKPGPARFEGPYGFNPAGK